MAEETVSRMQVRVLIDNHVNGRGFVLGTLINELESQLPGWETLTLTLRQTVPDTDKPKEDGEEDAARNPSDPVPVPDVPPVITRESLKKG